MVPVVLVLLIHNHTGDRGEDGEVLAAARVLPWVPLYSDKRGSVRAG